MLCLLCFGLWVHLRCTALNQGSVYCGVEPSPFWSPESKALITVVWYYVHSAALSQTSNSEVHATEKVLLHDSCPSPIGRLNTSNPDEWFLLGVLLHQAQAF
jgi:hypothetical protein